MLVNIAIGLLIAAVVLVVVRILVRTTVTVGKFLVIGAIVLLFAAAVLGYIGPYTS